MGNKKEYKIFEEKNLILEYYGGKFQIDELIAFKIAICEDENYNPNYNIIHDFRDAEFLFELKEISKFIDYTLNVRKNFGNRKSTMLTATPNQVVTSVGYELLKKDIPVNVKVVSTVSAALSFINIPLSNFQLIDSWLCDCQKNTSLVKS